MNEQETKDLFINPFYAINIAPELSAEHEPMTDKETWIKANAKLIDELGKEEWLSRLLHVLQTGGIKELFNDEIPN